MWARPLMGRARSHPRLRGMPGLSTAGPHAVDPGAQRIRVSADAKQNWIDSLRLSVKAGHGGNGWPIMGGVGGRGGHVILETGPVHGPAPNLLKVHQRLPKGRGRLTGDSGGHASKSRLVGGEGKDVVLSIPPGVSILNEAGREIMDMDQPHMRLIVANGGAGGCKDNHWFGQPGQKHVIRVDLKLIADVGLVGFPNAGKSTFLKAISRANPKIAAYPFTTIQPNLGHINYSDTRIVKVADLPGLIERAHQNVGMGHRFLKHVERTRLLLFVIDVNGFRLNPSYPFRTAFETVALLNREIELYNSDILSKPAVCVVNKMDVPGSGEKLDEFLNQMKDYASHLAGLPEELRPEKVIQFEEIIPMSAKRSPKSIKGVKNRLRFHLDELNMQSQKEAIQEGLAKIDHLIEGQGPQVS
ncbi:hypothetical protein TCAL_02445 [Tigriopus californicus]|uniref:OBG-type G domain-containing protein n=1 Tax=Tigriopus californicus TaxID=6832 RepID=A0A553NZX6_TIGCA|nr:GTP-binding protein 10 homolog [Tigriopus californicus]TRY70978.1 hypothetical protein TCAL_02445 [Tigriopus californicus]|eukprot:TCALIF_02445-PA protein Name:"Similar to GA10450 GTP-binding protein 10 homolog (Drosophila pseudoobscura pseudoobscura)" AED:0.06 eAED:0.06 QI:0/-1/0/1/-1/1/1/0/413